MGLDITAYTKMELVTGEEAEKVMASDDRWDAADERGWIIPSLNSSFAGREGSIQERPYRCANPDTEPLGFRAGSYSGYTWWRGELAHMVGIHDTQAFWNNPKDCPFNELINFSDCEGTIGPEASKKLLADFTEWADSAKRYAKQVKRGEFWLELYNTWTQAFELAADGGFVEFH